MSLEFARRLFAMGLLHREDLQRVLAAHLVRGIPIPLALIRVGILPPAAVEEELARSEAPVLREVTPVLALVRQLPAGICHRLLAVPVGFDGRNGIIDIAAADPFSRHVAGEISFHLRAPVRVLRAPLAMLEEALRTLPEGNAEPPPRHHRSTTPPYIVGIMDPIPNMPIPLVSKSIPAEPVIRLQRPKNDMNSLAPPSFRAPSGPFLDVGSVAASIRRAQSRDEVVEHLLVGLRTVARRVGVFAVRRGEFCGWRCHEELTTNDAFRRIRIPASTPSIFATATAMGFYLGPIPRTVAHRTLLDTTGDEAVEVAVMPVRVAGRIALFLFLEDIGDTMIATRRAEDLGRLTGDVLGKLVRQEKS